MKTSITFELGETIHKQRMDLVKEKDGTFTLIKHAESQRDQTDRISGIPIEVIKNMVNAIDMEVRYKKNI